MSGPQSQIDIHIRVPESYLQVMFILTQLCAKDPERDRYDPEIEKVLLWAVEEDSRIKAAMALNPEARLGLYFTLFDDFGEAQ